VISTAAIVLAAGSSDRFGSPKQLVDLNGRPLLEHVVTDVIGWPVDTVVVVLGAYADAILEAVDFGDATVAVNEDWPEGLASSLRVGFDILTQDPLWDQAFIALGDQPGIPAAVPRRLIEAAAESPRPATVPVYRYEHGHPVLFDRGLWPRLMTLSGDNGAASLLQAHVDWVENVRFPEVSPRDINTRDDLAALGTTRRRGNGRVGDH